LVLEAGLPAKLFGDASDGTDSDDTSVGSSVGYETSLSGSTTQDLAESPIFMPEPPRTGARRLSKDLRRRGICESGTEDSKVMKKKDGAKADNCEPKLVSMDQQLTTRTKLSSKANSFVPLCASPMLPLGPLPFVPMAAVMEAWQKFENRSDAKPPDSNKKFENRSDAKPPDSNIMALPFVPLS
jgi:hypothetical protein